MCLIRCAEQDVKLELNKLLDELGEDREMFRKMRKIKEYLDNEYKFVEKNEIVRVFLPGFGWKSKVLEPKSDDLYFYLGVENGSNKVGEKMRNLIYRHQAGRKTKNSKKQKEVQCYYVLYNENHRCVDPAVVLIADIIEAKDVSEYKNIGLLAYEMIQNNDVFKNKLPLGLFWFVVAVCHFMDKNYDQALISINKAIETNRRTKQIYYKLRAMVYIKQWSILNAYLNKVDANVMKIHRKDSLEFMDKLDEYFEKEYPKFLIR
ncbi:hypothetical protein M3Y97_00327000 [Aphelenchoides bicaudatus]|nr:hypothetical protein M3Y97_00327000 [Aphelenchoides bicaudatus]